MSDEGLNMNICILEENGGINSWVCVVHQYSHRNLFGACTTLCKVVQSCATIASYCTISINLTHTCDCDTLDQFDTSTQTTGDHDRVENSTLGTVRPKRPQNGNFGCIVWRIGMAESCERQNMQKPTEM